MLGEKLKDLTVEEYTTPSPVTVGPGSSMAEVSRIMDENGIRHLPVLEDSKVVGIISDRDLRLAMSLSGFDAVTAEKIMTPEPYVVSPETPLEEVAFTMSKNKFGSAIVQGNEGESLGIFTSTDALNALIELLRGQV